MTNNNKYHSLGSNLDHQIALFWVLSLLRQFLQVFLPFLMIFCQSLAIQLLLLPLALRL